MIPYEDLESRCHWLEWENAELKIRVDPFREIREWIARANTEDYSHRVSFLRTTTRGKEYCAIFEDASGTETYGYGESLIAALIDVQKRINYESYHTQTLLNVLEGD